jgi:hypothetical protein
MVEPSIYDQLAKESLSEMTLTQLNAGASVTAVDEATINYWRGIITLHRIASSSRTYAAGLPIPEASAVSSNTIADSASASVKPEGTEIWRVQSIHSSADLTVTLFDGTTNAVLMSGSSPQVFANLFLTPTLYLVITNGSGDSAVCNVAYHKVGL